jgi:polysaccharide pyruvyl transferase WcaK-like protein
VDRQLALLSHFDVVMTNKLHVGMCASAFGKPVLSIPLHSKIKRLYRQIRLEENCIPPEALPALDMKGKIDEMLSRGRVSIPAEVVERSRMNRDLVKQFVAGLDIPASTGEQT